MKENEKMGEVMRSARLEEIRVEFNEAWKDRVSKRELRTALKEQRSSWREENTKAETAWVKMLNTQDGRATTETNKTLGDVQRSVVRNQQEARVSLEKEIGELKSAVEKLQREGKSKAMEVDHESLQRVPSNQREKKFDLAGVAKRVEELRRELRDLRSTTDGLVQGKAVRQLSEEIRKQKDEMRPLTGITLL